MAAVMTEVNDEQPVTLNPGEQMTVTWDRNEVEQVRNSLDALPFTHCEFIDSLGNSYAAPYPGMRVTRRNWRLKRKYVSARPRTE